VLRGGKPQGAGRPAGKPSKKIKERVALQVKAAAEGISPLDVMLDCMRRHYNAKRYAAAAKIAKDAAPYCHSRLSSIEQEHSGNVAPVTQIEVVVDDDDEAGDDHAAEAHA
jgi:hypothetical protein